MNRLRSKFWIWLLVPCMTFSSCDDETLETVGEIIDEILNIFGFNMENEEVEDQEKDETDDTVITDTKVDWSSNFPPIGNQGSYGTCVAWASGYGLKTALNVIDGTWSDASVASRQVSPVDLWHVVPTSGKSTSCNGSNFEPVLQSMIDNNIATMSQVPFTNLKMTCDGVSGKGSSVKKLNHYRVVAYSADMSNTGKAYGMTVNNIKNHLKDGPLVIGAQLGNRFMSWNSSSVIDYDDKTYNGQHAYHALALVGFDDDKNAFRIRNSWGADDWGDQGCIWVDYDFFVDQFCFGVWSASNSEVEAAATKSSSTNDVKVVVLNDVQNNDGTRTVTYSLTNNGTSAISTADYPISYILFESKFFANRFTLMENAEIATVEASETVTLSHTYSLPTEVSEGKYYLVMIADPCNKIGDKNRTDNFSYVMGEAGLPLMIVQNKLNGVPQTIKETHTLVCANNPNAYRNSELEKSLKKAARK